jgi:glutaredoxin-related protein
MKKMQLSNDQQVALAAILKFLESKTERVFLLQGKPGTGKTFVLKQVLNQYKQKTVCTAPTNKATKVLKEVLTSPDYKPECCTIYSLLGLTMDSSGEVKEVVSRTNDFDINTYGLVIIDEAFMINSNLKSYIQRALKESPRVKILFLGDSYQLPPVKEVKSPIVSFFHDNNQVTLHQVMRHEGDILDCVSQVRLAIDTPFNFKLPFLKNYRGMPQSSSVEVLGTKEFEARVFAIASTEAESLIKSGDTKIIAWRNSIVDKYNHVVRSKIFPQTYIMNKFEVGDKIVVTSPCKDIEDRIFATIDEEGIVEKTIDGFNATLKIKTMHVQCTMDDNTVKIFSICHPEHEAIFDTLLEEVRQAALTKAGTWFAYHQLYESVHHIRHSYAITAHRAQGSTYKRVLVHAKDILSNKNTVESLQCLNVAMSRAKNKLIIGM